jgi:hypothetical protein
MDVPREVVGTNGELERRRIQTFRWTVWVFLFALTLYLEGVTLNWFTRPHRAMQLALRLLLMAFWVLYGLGLWWSQRLDRRLKG